jgi:hypothetical protein
MIDRADESRKIDEPKTPYVRYDAENDLVLGGKIIRTPARRSES